MTTVPGDPVSPPAPLSPELRQLLGQAYALHTRGRIKDARALYERILAQRPDSPEASFLLGNLLFQLGELDAAETALRRAVQFAPGDVRHLNALGVLLLRRGQAEAAAGLLERAAGLDPNSVDAWANLGAACLRLDRFAHAHQSLGRALQLRPHDSRVLNNLGNACLGLCRIEDSIQAYRTAFGADPGLLSALSNALLNTHYLATPTPEQVFAMHVEAGARFPVSTWQPEPRTGQARIRVGFLSGDFRTHSVAWFLLPLLQQLDRSRFELLAFYNDGRSDAMTECFRALFDHWYVVDRASDPELLALMREQALDLLVDLAGHTGNNRLPVLSQRVAPVQVNWLGYPHSTGVPAIDVRLVDRITDPAPRADRLASERLLRLPQGFLCYQGDESVPVCATPPCIENGYITFGSFNNLAKVNDAVLDCWIEILRRTPEARLLLKAKQLGEPSVQQRIAHRFGAAGIDPARLTLMGRVPGTASHLELYSRVDIALDTFPYNGTTTTCEALWMGVPVIAFAGDRHAARVSISILEHAGFAAFAGVDLADYKRLARDWARKPEALQQLRREMRPRLSRSALCDAPGFAATIDAAFTALVQT